jgi:hypothetical protein
LETSFLLGGAGLCSSGTVNYPLLVVIDP